MYLYWDSGGGYSGNQENRYVGFGNTVTPEKKEDDLFNNAMSSIYSVGRDVFNYWRSVFCFSHLLSACFSGLEQFYGWS